MDAVCAAVLPRRSSTPPTPPGATALSSAASSSAALSNASSATARSTLKRRSSRWARSSASSRCFLHTLAVLSRTFLRLSAVFALVASRRLSTVLWRASLVSCCFSQRLSTHSRLNKAILSCRACSQSNMSRQHPPSSPLLGTTLLGAIWLMGRVRSVLVTASAAACACHVFLARNRRVPRCITTAAPRERVRCRTAVHRR
mmetsp:Transcript_82143/g.163644  ORF Transcript_82143/g.163644 Transcript_82143/m.163644 type:complete len:201 (-) Transcript_82143:964-1566(-)